MKRHPLTRRQFIRQAERRFRLANSDVPTAEIEWLFISPVCPNLGGPGCYRGGRFVVRADGYRSRVMDVSAQSDGRWIIR